MDLHPALGARLEAFLITKFNKVLLEGRELEYAMLLHQTRMKDVCESIKAHDHWLRFREHFLNSISTAASVVVSFFP